jgi:hypothetical protein
MAASSTGLSGAISDISGNVEVVVNTNIKEKLKHISDHLDKLKAGVHGGVNVDAKSFVKYTMDTNKNLTPGESSQETRDHSGNEAKHNTPTAGAGNICTTTELQGSSPEVERSQVPFQGSKPPGLDDARDGRDPWQRYHQIGSPEPSEHLADGCPRSNTDRHKQEIKFDRGKMATLNDFDGKPEDFSHWRRRITSHISDENVDFGKLIDWARQQTSAITEQEEDKHVKEVAGKFGLDIKEFSRKFYNFICNKLGKTMESRMDRAQGGGLELWRALNDEYNSQAAQVLDAKMKLYQNPQRATNMDDLENKLNDWEQLARDIAAGGGLYEVADITKKNALDQLVTPEIENKFIEAVAHDGSLQTLSQRIAYTRQRITAYKAKCMSAKVLKHAPPVHQITPDDQWNFDGEPQYDGGEPLDAAAVLLMPMNDIIMYTNKGKGKG